MTALAWPRWQAQIVRRDGSTLVPALLDGAYDWASSRPVVSGGWLTTLDDPGDMIGARVLLWVDGLRVGGFVVTAVSTDYRTAGDVWRVEFMDEAARLQRVKLTGPLGLRVATPLIATVRTRLAALGVSAAIADDDQTTRTSRAWPANTSELDLVNELLGDAGFHPLRPTPTGLSSRRWTDPKTATVAHRFHEGEDALHLPQYPQDSDHLLIPNRIVVTSKGDATEPTLTAVARDLSTSRWSHSRRGDWIDAEPVTSDRTTQAELVAEAERRLADLQMEAVTMTITHYPIPELLHGMDAVVEIVADREAVAGRWQVTGSTMPWKRLATTTLRKVA